jgi:hypothetical protein
MGGKNKMDLQEVGWVMDWIDMAGTCKRGNKPSGSTQMRGIS